MPLFLSLTTARALVQFHKCHSPMEKYNFLSAIRYTNETLFYHLLIANMVEMVPIVYTPTVSKIGLTQKPN